MTAPAVIIVNYNGGADLPDCIAAVRAQTLAPVEIVVVDNCSTDGSAALVEPLGLRLLAMERNAGFGGAIDAAAMATTGSPLVVLNPDVTLRPNWLATIASAFESDDRLGVAGGKLLYQDERTVQHAGGIVREPLMLADHRNYGQPDDESETAPVDVDYVTGAAIAIRRQAFEQVGGFDEGFFLYFEETDLCRRVREAGWAVRYLPGATAIHRESAAIGRESAGYYRHYHHGRLRYALKHMTATAFLVDFVPAERARLGSVVSGDELIGLRHAYLDHACLLEKNDRTLASEAPALRPAVADALGQLAERATATTPTGLDDAHALEQRGSGLRPIAELRPHPFRSSLPGVAAARTAWNWMSTRWYLAPLIEQQSRFNREAADVLGRVEARLDHIERRLDLQTGLIAEIDRDVVALARQVGRDRGRADK